MDMLSLSMEWIIVFVLIKKKFFLQVLSFLEKIIIEKI